MAAPAVEAPAEAPTVEAPEAAAPVVAAPVVEGAEGVPLVIHDEVTGEYVDLTTGEILTPTPAPTPAPGPGRAGSGPGPDRKPPDRSPQTGRPPTPRMPRTPQRPAEAWITIPWDTLRGVANDPGHLKGFGPISAEQARAMVMDLLENGSWRCAAVDNDHNTLLGLGRRTYTNSYRPGTHLRRYTSALYGQQCAFPTCTTHARHCDFDHARPHRQGGTTCSCNGVPLCRRCHRLKTTGLIDVHPSTDPTHPHGTLIWTTTTGQRHLHRPTPLTPQHPQQIMNTLTEPPF